MNSMSPSIQGPKSADGCGGSGGVILGSLRIDPFVSLKVVMPS